MKWRKALSTSLKDMILALMGGLLGAGITLYMYNKTILHEVIILIVILTITLFAIYYMAKDDTFA